MAQGRLAAMAAAQARRIACYVYLGLISLFTAGVLVQAVLAGRFIFAAADPGPHIELGWPLAHMLAPLAFLVSLFLKGGRMFWMTSIVWVLSAVTQPILAALAEEGPSEGAAFHVVNALILFALSVALTHRATMLAMEKPAAASPPAPPRAPPMPGPPMRKP
jgi:hypothetical protein